MSLYTKPRFWAVAAAVGLAVGVLLYQVWVWEVERVEVGPEKFLVRVHKWGKDLPPDEIIAPDDSYKGIQHDVLPEGRHFLNPVVWRREIHPAIKVQPGKCLVLTRKFGTPIPKERLEKGDILAREGERGIVAEVKLPGIHRINPYAYEVEVVDAVEVKDNQVGVRTLKVGNDPRDLPPQAGGEGRYVVPDGFRGVQTTTARPGTHYINPYVEKITPVETRSHKVELSDIQFPSRDGFPLRPHVQVEYQVQADLAPQLFVRLSDEGVLHQEDATPEQQEKNPVLQKVLLPLIRGYARIEGSNFDARDFIVTDQAAGAPRGSNPREALQKALFTKIKPRCEELGIHILAINLGTFDVPKELKDQISERDLAKVQQDQFKAKLGELKAEQTLMAAKALKKQNEEKVQADTRLKVAQTKAEQMKEVELARLKQELENAQLRLDAARKEAEAKLAKGKAEAAVIQADNEAEVAGLRRAVLGFGGAGHYAQYKMLTKLAPALGEIFASDDSEFARMFAGYMTPPPGAGAPPPDAAQPKPAAGKPMPPAGAGPGN